MLAKDKNERMNQPRKAFAVLFALGLAVSVLIAAGPSSAANRAPQCVNPLGHGRSPLCGVVNPPDPQPTLPPAPPPAANDAAAITSLVNGHQAGPVNVLAIVQAAPYALAAYAPSDGNGGAQALLIQDASGNWSIVTIGGGSLAYAGYLVSLGVPSDTAQALVSGMAQYGL